MIFSPLFNENTDDTVIDSIKSIKRYKNKDSIK